MSQKLTRDVFTIMIDLIKPYHTDVKTYQWKCATDTRKSQYSDLSISFNFPNILASYFQLVSGHKLLKNYTYFIWT